MDGKDYEFDGKTYIHTDKDTGVKYRWDQDKNEWELIDYGNQTEKPVASAASVSLETTETSKDEAATATTSEKDAAPQGIYSYDGDTAIYTDPSDGSAYEWDAQKKAWIPKTDDEFIARYQLNYGFTEESRRPLSEILKEEREAAFKKEQEMLEAKAKKREKAALKEEVSWFEVDEKHNTKVYVSGLPTDITEEEFVDFMQKCGLVMKDVETGRMKVKLYTDSDGNLKGDALCTYIRIESVNMALQLLDGSDLRGKTVHVEQAQFQMKGSFNPGLKPKKRKRKDKEKLKKQQEKLFDWHPDKLRGERGRNERCVVVKNLFEPSLFDKEVSLILEYQQDLREECGKCGEVRKVIIYDRNPEGVAQIFFREAEEADECIKLLNDRWFGQRKITAEQWDGKTKYKIGETDAEIKARLQNWESFLETGDTDDSKPNSETPAEDKEQSEKTEDPAKSPESKSSEEISDPVKAEKSSVTEDNVKVSNVQEQSNVESDADSGDETEGDDEDP